MIEIVQSDNKILREVAKVVPIEEIESRKVETIIKRMKKALNSEEDGVAIAAPQIGESLRIFVISKKIYEIIEEEKAEHSKKSARQNLDELDKKFVKDNRDDLTFINPEILKMSKKKMEMEEGCLSARWLYGKVERAQKTLIKAFNEHGKIFTFGGSGILSQVFQHEVDHLNGIIFTDKAKDVRNIPPDTKERIN